MSAEAYTQEGGLIRLIYLALAVGWYVVTLGGQIWRLSRPRLKSEIWEPASLYPLACSDKVDI